MWSKPSFVSGTNKLKNYAKIEIKAFFVGEKMRKQAIKDGFITLGLTRAGRNLKRMTAGMPYYPSNGNLPASQSYLWWERLSAAYARSIPIGSAVVVYLGKGSELNIWNRVERPILEQRNIDLIYRRDLIRKTRPER